MARTASFSHWIGQTLAGVALTVLCAAAATAQEKRVQFDIPAQAVGTALATYARQANVEFMIPGSDITGITANAVRGEYETRQALELLLQGTGLEARFTPEGGVQIVRIKSSDGEASAQTSGGAQAEPTRLAQAEGNGASENEPSRAESSAAADAQLEEIVVTGTHIRGVTDTAAPTLVIDRQAIERSGTSTVEELVRTIPQNFTGVTTSSRFAIEGGPRLAGQNFDKATGVDLRGLGAESTLTLLNGTRRAGNLRGRVVDVSAIPLAAIEKVEIVTGGRSAIYGSDAVAGVVNFVTRRDFSGIETDASYGWSEEGAQRTNVSQLIGGGSDRGGFVATYDYLREHRLDLIDTALGIFPLIDGTVPLRNDLTPEVERHALFMAGHFSPNDRLELFADLMGTEKDAATRRVDLFEGATNASPQSDDVSNTYWSASGGARIDLAAAWQMSVTGTASRVRSRADFDQLADFGDFTFTNTVHDVAQTSLWSVSGVADGPLATLGRITPRAAFGIEHRRERLERDRTSLVSFDGELDPPSLTTEDGDREISSLFVEVLVPIATRLELTLSGRYDHYSDFGDTTNPLAGLIWKPTDDLTLRAAYSKAFRAPALVDLEPFSGVNLDLVDDPVSGGLSPVLERSGNNPGLGPEKAETWSVGLDLHPRALPWADFSLSYFNVDYRDRIDIPAFAFADQALILEREGRYPGLIDRAPTAAEVAEIIGGDSDGSIGNLTGTPFNPSTQNALDVFPNLVVFDNRGNNIAVESLDGLDAQLDGRLGFGPDEISFGINATYTLDHERSVTATSPIFDLLNEVGKPVDFRARANAGWTRNALGAFVFLNYAQGYDDPFSTPVSRIGSSTTVDLNFTFDGSSPGVGAALKGLRASLNIANLFDRDPPRFRESNFGLGYDAVNASPLGRYVTARLVKTW